MKQKWLYALALLVAAVPAFAAPVDKAQARLVAEEFVMQNASLSRSAKQVKTQAERLQPALEWPELYAFNVGSDGGFVVVSADDRTVPVLGYAESGALREDDMPPAMRAWLAQYQSEIQLITAGKAVPRRVEGRARIETLLTTHWDQSAPYNAECPVVDGRQCVTGCVATALAQVMNYHQWPQEATREISAYNTATYSIYVDTLKAAVFDWSRMGATGSGDVARLMAYCGAAVRMDYSPDESGASSALVPDALVQYFGYDASAVELQRSNFSIAEWENLLYDELKAGRPVLYGGRTWDNHGHEFVCDGYDGDGKFHVNWGWGGRGDGYYVLSVLEPSFSGIGASTVAGGYSLSQTMIVGIAHTGQATEQVQEISLSSIVVQSDNVLERQSEGQDFGQIDIELTVRSRYTEAGQIGLALYEGNNFVRELAKATGTIGTSGAKATLPVRLGVLTDGEYRIVAVSKMPGQSDWTPVTGSDVRYVQAVVSGNQLVLTVCPVVSLKVLELAYPEGKHAGSLSKWVATIANNGSEYNGNLWVVADDYVISGSGVYIEAGDTAQILFYIEPTRTVKIATDEAAQNVIYSGPDEKRYIVIPGVNLQLTNAAIEGNPVFLRPGTPIVAGVNVNDVGDVAVSTYEIAYRLDDGDLVPIANPTPLSDGVASNTVRLTLPEVLASGLHTLTFSITAINGTQVDAYDEQEAVTFAVYQRDLGRQKVLLQHFTYTGAGANVVMDPALDAAAELSDDFARVSVHINTYGMYISEGLAYAQFIASVPVVNFDRLTEQNADTYSTLPYLVNGRYIQGADIAEQVAARKQEPTFLKLNVTTEKQGDEEWIITVSGQRTDDCELLTGNALLTVMVTEDSVAQRQYDGRSAWIEDYRHHGVLRAVLTDTWGDSIAWQKDNTFTRTFVFAPRSEWRAEAMNVVVLAAHGYNGENSNDLAVQNCESTRLVATQEAGIGRVLTDAKAAPKHYYSPSGVLLNKPQKGLNIVRLTNGEALKTIIK